MSSVIEQTPVAIPREQPKPALLREKEIVERLAASRLRRSPYPEVRRVACEFYEGMLRLRGRIPSYYLKQVAQTVVLGMIGVDEVDNQLEVVTPPGRP